MTVLWYKPTLYAQPHTLTGRLTRGMTGIRQCLLKMAKPTTQKEKDNWHPKLSTF